MKSAKINEIFESIQGEGLYVGEYQLFVRFSGCNLNCAYCDTNHDFGKMYNEEELIKIINSKTPDTVSLTGGEPLVYADFLSDILPEINKKIYLETNGTLYDEMEKIKDLVDIVAADIKLQSATGNINRFQDNREFIKNCPKEKTFIKVVFDKNIKDDEIETVLDIVSDIPLVLQPKMPIDKELDIEKVFLKFYKKHKNTRLIPQTHKFLNIR